MINCVSLAVVGTIIFKEQVMDLDYRCYEDFIKFWIPIYKKQVNIAKLENNELALIEIYDNIDKNWNLQKYKYFIFKELGISYLVQAASMQVKKVEDADQIIIESYFRHRKDKANEIY